MKNNQDPNEKSAASTPLSATICSAVGKRPLRPGRYLWSSCPELIPFKEVRVFEGCDGRLIVVMPDSGAHHYIEDHRDCEWGGLSQNVERTREGR